MIAMNWLICIIAVISGFILIPVLEKLVSLIGRNVSGKPMIDEEYYKAAILPSNKGRSIDLVVENLTESNITPQFTLNKKSE